jgi:hypothetical protein
MSAPLFEYWRAIFDCKSLFLIDFLIRKSENFPKNPYTILAAVKKPLIRMKACHP